MIIKELKLIFVHIPKTGGTTIERIFEKSLGISSEEYLPSVQTDDVWTQKNFVHETLFNIKTKIFPIHPDFVDEDFDRYESFSVVRDPCSWVESLYNYSKLFHPLPETIDSFVHEESHPRHLKRFHRLSQIDYLRDHNTDRVLVDRVFAFERFDQVIDFVQDKLPKPITSVPHLRRIETVLQSKNRKRSYLSEKNFLAIKNYLKEDVTFHRQISLACKG